MKKKMKALQKNPKNFIIHIWMQKKWFIFTLLNSLPNPLNNPVTCELKSIVPFSMVYSLSERFNQELNIRYINRYNLIPTKICMHTLCMHVSSLLLPIGPFISVCSLLCFLIESFLQFCICILNFEQNPASSILQYVRTGKVICKGRLLCA